MSWIENATGGGGSGTLEVDGNPVSNPNLNSTTPAAPPGDVNVTWQVNGSNISGYVPFGGSSANIQSLLGVQESQTINVPTVTTGIYRISSYVTVTTPGSDTLTLSFSWTDEAGGQVFNSPISAIETYDSESLVVNNISGNDLVLDIASTMGVMPLHQTYDAYFVVEFLGST